MSIYKKVISVSPIIIIESVLTGLSEATSTTMSGMSRSPVQNKGLLTAVAHYKPLASFLKKMNEEEAARGAYLQLLRNPHDPQGRQAELPEVSATAIQLAARFANRMPEKFMQLPMTPSKRPTKPNPMSESELAITVKLVQAVDSLPIPEFLGRYIEMMLYRSTIAMPQNPIREDLCLTLEKQPLSSLLESGLEELAKTFLQKLNEDPLFTRVLNIEGRIIESSISELLSEPLTIERFAQWAIGLGGILDEKKSQLACEALLNPDKVSLDEQRNRLETLTHLFAHIRDEPGLQREIEKRRAIKAYRDVETAKKAELKKLSQTKEKALKEINTLKQEIARCGDAIAAITAKKEMTTNELLVLNAQLQRNIAMREAYRVSARTMKVVDPQTHHHLPERLTAGKVIDAIPLEISRCEDLLRFQTSEHIKLSSELKGLMSDLAKKTDLIMALVNKELEITSEALSAKENANKLLRVNTRH